MFPNEYTLTKKQSRTGILAYEVPADETQFSISYQTVFEDQSEGNLFFIFFTANDK